MSYSGRLRLASQRVLVSRSSSGARSHAQGATRSRFDFRLLVSCVRVGVESPSAPARPQEAAGVDGLPSWPVGSAIRSMPVRLRVSACEVKSVFKPAQPGDMPRQCPRCQATRATTQDQRLPAAGCASLRCLALPCPALTCLALPRMALHFVASPDRAAPRLSVRRATLHYNAAHQPNTIRPASDWSLSWTAGITSFSSTDLASNYSSSYSCGMCDLC